MRIKHFEYVANQRTLIKASTDEWSVCIKYTDIRPYWSEARPSLLENGRAFIEGNFLIFTMLIASGQAGVVCVWDCEHNKLTHISEGSYCVAATIADGKLYTLHDISNYCLPYHLRVYACPFGTMDANQSGTALYADTPVKIEDYNETVPKAKLFVDEGRITVKLGEQEVLFTADVSNAHIPKEEYSSFYKPAEKSMDPSVGIRKGMLL